MQTQIPMTEAAASPHCVVLVDDDLPLLRAMKFALETEGVAVAAFLSGEAALAAPAASYTCFVLDQRLPGMSGLDLLERYRARGETAPAVLITTNPSSVTRARAQAAGVEIIEKPLLDGALTRKVLELTAPAANA